MPGNIAQDQLNHGGYIPGPLGRSPARRTYVSRMVPGPRILRPLGRGGSLVFFFLSLIPSTPVDGFVRVVARRDNHRIVGWQAVGAGVSELSTAFSHSIEMGACLEDVAGTIHAHPTLGEAVQEAALRALGHALHI
jgi:hypothetical protein